MIRLLALVLFAVTVCMAAAVQDSEQYSKCVNKASTQTAMHICANEEVKRADAELNEIYQKLLSAAESQAGAIEKIRAAERAWITYRDAYIEAMYPKKDKLGAYGSTFPMEVDLLRAKLTREQTGALKDLLKQYDGSKQ